MTSRFLLCALLVWHAVAIGATPGAGEPAVAADPFRPVESGQGYDLYRIAFRGGEPAEVGVAGAEGRPVGLQVFDAARRLICDLDPSEEEQVCRWNPDRTEDYWIRVRNSSGADIAYRIWTN